ncbi:DUF2252 domain-containing protein [Janibacter indicus]|uniref:Uncharacterized conserved protein, DUF2252 family n=1 Tax=Janibacter indicus TaxID=857417 RepID=A0A1W1ZCG2_9MICO|nr:DUF2252 domain-containing protein [Janibacter indicus]SMC45881.1 Uncharacterized conserved protein, DUF2252 family [Janibacter indicus]
MTSSPGSAAGEDERRQHVVETLEAAFADLMAASPDAFRVKFRKMADSPFAFYRGSACLFHRDMVDLDEPWADERTSRMWIHGDLHPENFGTYVNSHGELVFDVNDYDEAYVGPFTWDLRRFVAGLAVMGWRKALPEQAVRDLAATYLRSYLELVQEFVDGADDTEFALRLGNTDGAVHATIQRARRNSRAGMLDAMSEVTDEGRVFTDGVGVRRLDDAEREQVLEAYGRYLETIPEAKRAEHETFYEVKDVVGRSGFGIGSAGLPAYSLLIEGYNEAHENDVVLSMKQANRPALADVVDLPRARELFAHEGERTVVSQRALQVHADPLLGYTTVDGVGYVVDEVSPYEIDLSWVDLHEPVDIEPVVVALGRATAKIHCVSDADSDHTVVDFHTEAAIAEAVAGHEEEFVEQLVDFAIDYADRVRADHALFVSAFREGRIGAVDAVR